MKYFIVFFYILITTFSCNPTKIVELKVLPSPKMITPLGVETPVPSKQIPTATPKIQNRPLSSTMIKQIPTAAPAGAFNENIIRGKEFLLQQRGSGGIIAQDETLGPLGNEFDNPEAWKTASSFLDSLLAEKPDTSLYSQRWKDFLSRIVSLGLTQSGKIKSWRMGPWISISETSIYAKFFLEGESKTIGLIYLSLEDKKWTINDLQVDFKQLKLKPQAPQETQDPFQFGKSQPMNIY